MQETPTQAGSDQWMQAAVHWQGVRPGVRQWRWMQGEAGRPHWPVNARGHLLFSEGRGLGGEACWASGCAEALCPVEWRPQTCISPKVDFMDIPKARGQRLHPSSLISGDNKAGIEPRTVRWLSGAAGQSLRDCTKHKDAFAGTPPWGPPFLADGKEEEVIQKGGRFVHALQKY